MGVGENRQEKQCHVNVESGEEEGRMPEVKVEQKRAAEVCSQKTYNMPAGATDQPFSANEAVSAHPKGMTRTEAYESLSKALAQLAKAAEADGYEAAVRSAWFQQNQEPGDMTFELKGIRSQRGPSGIMATRQGSLRM